MGDKWRSDQEHNIKLNLPAPTYEQLLEQNAKLLERITELEYQLQQVHRI